MKRKEQIQDAASDHRDLVCCSFYDPVADTRQESFICGAKWADENPQSGLVNKDEFVAKVRNWLEKHTYDDKYWTPDGDDLFLGNLIGDICKYLEE